MNQYKQNITLDELNEIARPLITGLLKYKSNTGYSVGIQIFFDRYDIVSSEISWDKIPSIYLEGPEDNMYKLIKNVREQLYKKFDPMISFLITIDWITPLRQITWENII